MTRPTIRIFLIRHGLSEANLDKGVNARKPDHAVELAGTPDDETWHASGHVQAQMAGVKLAEHILATRPQIQTRTSGIETTIQTRRARMLVSPYLRTRQTADSLELGLRRAGIVFDRREVPELREISFGLYDGLTDEELAEQFPREHAHYDKHTRFEGEYFAPMPMGESRIQVGDRVKSVFGTILRDAEPRPPESGGEAFSQRMDPLGRGPILDFFVVSHGVTIRQFIHRWMHHPWEWAEAEPNPGNCAIRVIEGRSGLGYAETTLFEGYRHDRRAHAAQEHREDGHAR
jgi:broad specificity phosphatase PhoE